MFALHRSTRKNIQTHTKPDPGKNICTFELNPQLSICFCLCPSFSTCSTAINLKAIT